MEINKIVRQNLLTDMALRRVEIFVLHHSIPENTERCVSSILKYTDWPFKLTILDTSYYQRGLLAKIYNKLLEESTCEYVAFVCSDAEFENPWLEKLFKDLISDVHVMCVTPLIIPSVNRSSDLSPYTGIYNISPNELSMSVSLFPKHLILDSNGFDERYYLYGHDSALLNKLNHKGAKFLIDTSVTVRHKVGSTTKRLFTPEELELVKEYNKTI